MIIVLNILEKTGSAAATTSQHGAAARRMKRAAAGALPSSQWTLVGVLMVQLHAAAAGLAGSRLTADVAIMLHIETGAAVMAVLSGPGYTLEFISDDDPALWFVRGKQQIDVMIADHRTPAKVPRIGGRKPYQIAVGVKALQRTVNCRMTADDDGPVLISIPNALGARVLIGAARREDFRVGLHGPRPWQPDKASCHLHRQPPL